MSAGRAEAKIQSRQAPETLNLALRMTMAAPPATAPEGAPPAEEGKFRSSVATLLGAAEGLLSLNDGSTKVPPKARTFASGAGQSRCTLAPEQLEVLKAVFARQPLPSAEQRHSLAKRLGITPRSIQVWFQNRRQRHKVAGTLVNTGEKALGSNCYTNQVASPPCVAPVDVEPHVSIPSPASTSASIPASPWSIAPLAVHDAALNNLHSSHSSHSSHFSHSSGLGAGQLDHMGNAAPGVEPGGNAFFPLTVLGDYQPAKHAKIKHANSMSKTKPLDKRYGPGNGKPDARYTVNAPPVRTLSGDSKPVPMMGEQVPGTNRVRLANLSDVVPSAAYQPLPPVELPQSIMHTPLLPSDAPKVCEQARPRHSTTPKWNMLVRHDGTVNDCRKRALPPSMNACVPQPPPPPPPPDPNPPKRVRGLCWRQPKHMPAGNGW